MAVDATWDVRTIYTVRQIYRSREIVDWTHDLAFCLFFLDAVHPQDVSESSFWRLAF